MTQITRGDPTEGPRTLSERSGFRRTRSRDSRVVIWFLLMFLFSCGGGHSPDAGFTTSSPSKFLALQALGIQISAYVVVSTDPDNHQPLTLDAGTNNFTGEIKATTGKSFDLTVVYTANDPISGQDLEIAHYIRRGLYASGSTMEVKYQGDESNWETTFDLTPGTPNVLNLDGDAYNNFIEIGYGSDPNNALSLPLGASASATRPDPLFGSADVGLPPPGSDSTSALHGNAELTLKADTPFDIEKFEIVSPSYGVDLLSSSDEILTSKTMKIRIATKRFVTGSQVGQMSLTVRITDEYQLVRETTLTFAVYNPNDDLAPTRLQLSLNANQVVQDRLAFIWEIDDPSGINAGTVSVLLRNPTENFTVLIPVTDTNVSSTRLLANISEDLTLLPDGTYQVEFEARDSSSSANLYFESVAIRIANSRPVTSFGAIARILKDGVPFSGSVPENSSSVIQLDGSQSNGPFASQPRGYSWLCDTPTPFVAQGARVTLPLPDVSRASGTRQITCTLTFTNGNMRDQADATLGVTFVNRPPQVTNSITVTQSSPTSPSLPMPDNFKINWGFLDPDGDALTYNLTITPEGEASSITCTGLTGTEIMQGSSQSNCTLNRIGYGESVTSFSLSPRTDYTLTVTARDPDSSTPSTTVETMSDKGLRGWWRFDEDLGEGSQVTDSSGNNYHGVNRTNDPDNTVAGVGIRGQALSCDGVSDYVMLSNNAPALGFGRGSNWTVEAKVRVDTQLSTSNIISFTTPTGAAPGASFGVSSEGPGFGVSHASSPDSEISTSAGSALVGDGSFHHLVGVYQGDPFVQEGSLYLDGTLIATDTASLAFFEADDFIRAAFCTAGHYDYQFNRFTGLIDEVAIYNRALTVDEIRRNCRMNDSGNSCPDPKEPIILTPLPNQTLPPTRAYWSWRGERGEDGNLIYPNLTYEASFRIDLPGPAGWLGPTSRGLITSGYYVEDPLEVSSNYELIITATDPTTRQQYQSTRTFSTDDSVVAWWKFDGSFADSSGNGLTGSSSGTYQPTFVTNGSNCFGVPVNELVDRAACFVDDDYIDLAPRVGSLAFDSTDDFTVEARFRPDTARGTVFALLNGSGSRPGTQIYYYNSGTIMTEVADARSNPDDQVQVLSPNHPVGSFHHAAMAYDGKVSNSVLTLTVGGVPQGLSTDTFSFSAADFEVAAIGAATHAGLADPRFFEGLIDEVVIYNTALSPETSRNNFCALEALAGTDPLPDVCTD